MSQTYQARRRDRTAPAEPKPQTAAPGPSLQELAAGAMPSTEQMGRQVDLPGAIREKMEASFGADFSGVKVFESQTVADAGAQAMTMGSNIAFAPGQLDLVSTSGQAVLGHELSHVVSQARGESAGQGFLADSGLEAQADRQGMLAAQGESAYAGPVSPVGVSAVPAAAAGPMQAKKQSTINAEKEAALEGATLPGYAHPIQRARAKKHWNDTRDRRAQEQIIAYKHLGTEADLDDVGSLGNADTTAAVDRGVAEYWRKRDLAGQYYSRAKKAYEESGGDTSLLASPENIDPDKPGERVSDYIEGLMLQAGDDPEKHAEILKAFAERDTEKVGKYMGDDIKRAVHLEYNSAGLLSADKGAAAAEMGRRGADFYRVRALGNLMPEMIARFGVTREALGLPDDQAMATFNKRTRDMESDERVFWRRANAQTQSNPREITKSVRKGGQGPDEPTPEERAAYAHAAEQTLRYNRHQRI